MKTHNPLKINNDVLEKFVIAQRLENSAQFCYTFAVGFENDNKMFHF